MNEETDDRVNILKTRKAKIARLLYYMIMMTRVTR